MHFPLMTELESRPCLVVGSGEVASRRRAALERFGAAVRVVSPETAGRGFDDADVDGMTLVVAATDDRGVNRRVAAACRRRGVPVNVVDDAGLSTFFFPAVAVKGPFVVAVSTGGRCPVAARMLRDRLAGAVDGGFADAVRRLGEGRDELKRKVPDAGARREYCEKELERWKD